MFKDYYAILEILPTATATEIKSAYYIQSKKWHPDLNSSQEAKQRMQDINEAYLILKDIEAREKYDFEYERFKQQYQTEGRASFTKNETYKKQAEYTYTEYHFADDILEKWIRNAHTQARKIVEEALDELKGATQNAGSAMFSSFIYYLIGILLMSLIFGLARGCN